MPAENFCRAHIAGLEPYSKPAMELKNAGSQTRSKTSCLYKKGSSMNIVILITCASKEEAAKIAQGLIAKKLAACANQVDKVNSLFWWQGKVDSAQESLLIIKSQKALLKKIIKQVKSLHSYKVPEIIALPIIGGNIDYLDWIDESVRQPV